MARITHGAPKADKNLKGPRIGWTGAVIRDGRGYYGESETDIPAKEAGAFPPKLADISRLRASPVAALKAELAAQKTVTTSVTYRDGAEVVTPAPKKENHFKRMWAELRSNPQKLAEFQAKAKAGYARWLAKRKGL